MKTYTSNLTSIPSWLSTYGDQTGKTLDVNFGFGPDGMYFVGNAGGEFGGPFPGYSVRTNFNISAHQACELVFTVDRSTNFTDQGICFYIDGGETPNWNWNPHSSRIAFQTNSRTPYIFGTDKYVSNNGEYYGSNSEGALPVLDLGTYTFKVIYNPASRIVAAVTYQGADTSGAVLDTIILHEKLMGGSYRIGFDADNDDGLAYFKNLTINVYEANGVSNDTELNDQLSNLKENHSQVTDLVEGALFYFADDADLEDGSDPNFNELGIGNTICIQNDGKIVVAGYSGTNDGSKNIRRIDVSGNEDESFTPPSSFNGRLSSVVQMSDGRLVVGGNFTSFERFDGASNGTSISQPSWDPEIILDNQVMIGAMICLNPDGSISKRDGGDIGFEDRAISGIAVSVYTIKLLDDDSVLVGGHFTHYDNIESPYLAKIDSDGVIDEVFAANIVALGLNDLFVSSIAIDSNGKILIGGAFATSIIRLNSNGSLDSSFDSGTGFSGGFIFSGAFEILPLTTGKMLVGHSGTDYNGSPCNPGLVRLNNDGSLDGSYAPNLYNNSEGFGAVFTIAQQENGKVLVGGFFDRSEGDSFNKIVRLNTDGSLDESFSSGFGFTPAGHNWGPQTNDIKLDSNGNIYVAGSFTDYNHAARFQYAKLNTNGVLQEWSVLPAFKQMGIDDGMRDVYDSGNFINTNLTQLYLDIKCYGGNNAISGGEGGCSDNYEKSIPSTHTMAWNADGDAEDDFYDDSFPNDLAKYRYQPITDSHVMVGDGYFGNGSSYFTAMLPGMFVLAANNINISQFSITGDIGADGNGVEVAEVYPISAGGSSYTAYLKSNYSGNDPSINHIIIVDGNASGIEQFYDTTSRGDEHCLTGLDGKTKLFYLIISKGCIEDLDDTDCGNRMSPNEVRNVVAKFLEVVGLGSCGSLTYELNLSPENPEIIPNYAYDGEGNMDTAIIVDPVTGKRRSIQRTGYFELTDNCGNRKIVSSRDGESFSLDTNPWYNAVSSFVEPVVVTPTPTPTPTATPTPTPEPTATSTPEPTATATPEPTATATPEPTAP
jgi:uncharacterized delta-60 repeat protein